VPGAFYSIESIVSYHGNYKGSEDVAVFLVGNITDGGKLAIIQPSSLMEI